MKLHSHFMRIRPCPLQVRELLELGAALLLQLPAGVQAESLISPRRTLRTNCSD
jgi:hypothetical protein